MNLKAWQKKPLKMEHRGKKLKKNDTISELWKNFKQLHIYVIGVPKGEGRRGQNKHLRNHDQKCFNLVNTVTHKSKKTKVLQVPETWIKLLERCSIIKWLTTSNKENILKAAGAKRQEHRWWWLSLSRKHASGKTAEQHLQILKGNKTC